VCQYLQCSHNRLVSLPDLPMCQDLWCWDNQLAYFITNIHSYRQYIQFYKSLKIRKIQRCYKNYKKRKFKSLIFSVHNKLCYDITDLFKYYL